MPNNHRTGLTHLVEGCILATVIDADDIGKYRTQRPNDIADNGRLVVAPNNHPDVTIRVRIGVR
jgi:hypothetical protein